MIAHVTKDWVITASQTQTNYLPKRAIKILYSHTGYFLNSSLFSI
jgi:hypothetical protein